jgi:RNA polymerase sigma-70 factor (ECF subfamily)
MSPSQAGRSVNSQLPDAPYSDLEWIDRIRASDVQAFEALVLHYSKKLCDFVFHSLGDAEATRELVQDLFFWVWRNRHEWQIRGGLTSYLYRSARNRAISHARHARVERDWQQQLNHEPLKGPSHADADVEVEDLRAAFSRALESLPERPRQVFLLHREHHLTYSQIGEVLGISRNTVEVHMTRALTGLRIRLSDWLR